MYYLKYVKDIRFKIRTKTPYFQQIVGGTLRKQIPLCQYHHNLYHKGELLGYEIKRFSEYCNNLQGQYIMYSKNNSSK